MRTSAQSGTLCVNIGATPSRTVGRARARAAAGGREGSGARNTTAVHEGTAVKIAGLSLESSPFPYAGLNQFRFDGCVLRPAHSAQATPNGLTEDATPPWRAQPAPGAAPGIGVGSALECADARARAARPARRTARPSRGLASRRQRPVRPEADHVLLGGRPDPLAG